MLLKRFALVCALLCAVLFTPVLASSGPAYAMKTERPVYAGYVDSIDVIIKNATGEETSYDMYFTLERYGKDGFTAVIPQQEVAVADLAALLPAHATGKAEIPLDAYEKPLPPGQYRVTKNVGGMRLEASFRIADATHILSAGKPQSITIALGSQAQANPVTVGPDESPSTVLSIWYRLLAFPKGTPPEGSRPDSEHPPLVTLTLADEAGKETTLFLYDFGVEGPDYWAAVKGRSGWYRAEAGFLESMEATAAELGAFAPPTGEALIKALNGMEPLKNVRFTAHQFTTPFQLPGWQSDRKKSGVTLSVFQFPSAKAVNNQMKYLYEDGYTLRLEVRSEDGKLAAFERKRYDWDDPPHYFKAGSWLVLYNGSNQAVLDGLTKLLGPQVTPKP